MNQADSMDALSMFYSLNSLLETMPVHGGDTKAAWLLLINCLEKWADLRKIDEKSSDIDRTLSELQRKIADQVH